jgi:hypothetical protein
MPVRPELGDSRAEHALVKVDVLDGRPVGRREQEPGGIGRVRDERQFAGLDGGVAASDGLPSRCRATCGTFVRGIWLGARSSARSIVRASWSSAICGSPGSRSRSATARSDDALTALADTIKTLSDRATDSTVVLVGVARSIGELVGEHASIVRALVPTGRGGAAIRSMTQSIS